MIALVLVMDGFEELEAVTVIDILRRANISTTVVTIINSPNRTLNAETGRLLSHVVGSNKLHLVPDATLEMVDGHFVLKKSMAFGETIILETEKIAVVLPGGMGGVQEICSSALALELIKKVYDSKESILGAICAAPMALKEAGIVGKDIQLTAYPSFKDDLSGVYTWRDDVPVVRSGSRSQLITSRGPGTAIPFALALVEAIAGSEMMKRVVSAGLFESSAPGNLE